MPPPLLLEPTSFDLGHVLADREAIRAYNPQRHEMEQLDAIVFIDTDQRLIVGYKDVREDEFWVKGHIPGFPLLPGVLICEAAAQLCSYFVMYAGYLSEGFLGFGGMENIRFRSPVRPGDRLVLIGKGTRIHRRQTIFSVQGFVGETMVFHGDIMGAPLQRLGSATPPNEEA